MHAEQKSINLFKVVLFAMWLLNLCLPACLSVCLSVCLSLSLYLSPPPLSLSPSLSRPYITILVDWA